MHTSHYSSHLEKPNITVSTKETIPRIYCAQYLSLRIRTPDASQLDIKKKEKKRKEGKEEKKRKKEGKGGKLGWTSTRTQIVFFMVLAGCALWCAKELKESKE